LRFSITNTIFSPSQFFLAIYLWHVLHAKFLKCGQFSYRITNYTIVFHAERRMQPVLQPHFTLKEIIWYSFLLAAEWTPGPVVADRTNRSLENFQERYRELKAEPPVLWRTTSTKCLS
jgi:hypothetical protein